MLYKNNFATMVSNSFYKNTASSDFESLKKHCKELNEILNKTRRTKDINLSVEQIEELIKDLEELEKQDKILEILKKRLNIKIPYGSVNVISCNNDYDYLLFEVELKEHTKIEEWLDGKD